MYDKLVTCPTLENIYTVAEAVLDILASWQACFLIGRA